MARLSPNLNAIRQDTGLFRELDVLERLEESLPEGYEIFHSVAWHSIDHGQDRHGEIDIVILGPNGHLLLMEIKAGHVQLRDGELIKLYTTREHDIARQLNVQRAALLHRLREAGLHAPVTTCLVLPDYRMQPGGIVALSRERIIDADDFPYLGARVQELMRVGEAHSDLQSLHRFLANEFQVSVDLRVLDEQLQRTSQRLAEGLATWVPRIQAPNGLIRIQATAGSGKTQLALRLLGDAVDEGRRALYVCFNRSLADHIARLAPVHADVTSYSELCVRYYRRHYGEPDFAAPDNFDLLARVYCEASDEWSPIYDLIIIDEGQDFQPAWVESLLPQLKSSGHLYLLEDDAQRLYERARFDLADAVTLTCNDNFRSPRMICEVINALRLSDQFINPRSPYSGDVPAFRVYQNEKSLLRETAEAVKNLMARGIALSDIVVLSGQDRFASTVLNAHRIGDCQTRRFTGDYTPDGDPIWTDGDLLVETIHRFKGRSASGVVLTELDFDALTERERRAMFVGMTRSCLAVELVLSEQAESCLAMQLAC
ncbi:MAG: ATP-binding domain-containing protein [Lautropia sp.]|nr:ATP-binding domain-containing protein [Lautropia sp.]